jgi:hypothetical protein
MTLKIVSYYIDVLTEVEFSASHTQVTELKVEAHYRYNQVVKFFAHHFNTVDGMNCGNLDRSNLNEDQIVEGKELIKNFFTFLISNKVTNLDVTPHGNYCDVTKHWINHLLGNPESIEQKNIFNVMVSPKVNWYSMFHNTKLWNNDLPYAKVQLKRILDNYSNGQSLFIVRNGNTEQILEYPDQVVTYLSSMIREHDCQDYRHPLTQLVGNGLQLINEVKHQGVPTGYISLALNY